MFYICCYKHVKIMCNCKFFNGDSCDYYDYANGKTEDGYCSFENEDNPDNIDCDEYTEDVE